MYAKNFFALPYRTRYLNNALLCSKSKLQALFRHHVMCSILYNNYAKLQAAESI